MPELPEVETIRRQLEPELLGREIRSLEVIDERWTRPEPPGEVEAACEGRRIEAIGRRGKYLLMGLDDGLWLVMHLRMTGNLVLMEAGAGGSRGSCARGSGSTTAASSCSPTRAGSGPRSCSRTTSSTLTSTPGPGSNR